VVYSEAGSAQWGDTFAYLAYGAEPSYTQYVWNWVRYVACAGTQSFGLMTFNDVTAHTSFNVNPIFLYWGLLEDVNPNFGYYTQSPFTYQIHLRISYDSGTTFNTVTSSLSAKYNYKSHYIVDAVKTLLQTGDAMYPIACSNGATPTGQWATDMWVFDNNATLGYPCIGRVPNMLLGVGTFTYLKPVQLITAPDAGSNLWLPVGTYGTRTLLMRCYSQ
jgi:hypothetical protein